MADDVDSSSKGTITYVKHGKVTVKEATWENLFEFFFKNFLHAGLDYLSEIQEEGKSFDDVRFELGSAFKTTGVLASGIAAMALLNYVLIKGCNKITERHEARVRRSRKDDVRYWLTLGAWIVPGYAVAVGIGGLMGINLRKIQDGIDEYEEEKKKKKNK